jgi:hypothetical protein
MEMKRFRRNIRLKLTTSWGLSVCMILGLALSGIHIIKAQNTFSDVAIKNLREGHLLIRFPTYTAKIDTLNALIARSTDEGYKKRLQKLLNDTTADRDTFFKSYVAAFRENYTFSHAGYFFDIEARNLNTANYYTLQGDHIAPEDLNPSNTFYLYFERTEESKIDAMVIYDYDQNKMRSPFPNNFAQAGVNFLFLKFSSKKNFPSWRVEKMNKRLWKYFNDVKMNSDK